MPSIGWSSEGRLRPGIEPRHQDGSRAPAGGSGGRNLIVGIIILLIALGLLWQALMFLGLRAILPVGTALLAFVTLFVLARSRVLRQRNGGFVALAVICLLGALMALADYGSHRLAGVPATPGVTRNTVRASEELPLLSQSYEIPAAGENASRFRVLRDLKVVIDEKAHLIKGGEIFPVAETGDGEVHFIAGDQQIALPMNFVELIKPATATPAQPSAEPTQVAATAPTMIPAATPQPGQPAPASASTPSNALPVNETPVQLAQKEAIRRYPALGQQGSAENQLFIETYQELKHSGADDFFADPQWPLQLAELLAKREKWQRGGAGAIAPGTPLQGEPALSEPEVIPPAPGEMASEPESTQSEPGEPAPGEADPTGALPQGESGE